MRKSVVVLLLFFLPLLNAVAEKTVINGKAPAYAGKKITLNIYEDYLSFTLKRLTETTISSEGKFTLEYDFSAISEVVMRIDGVSAYMYVQPGSTYSITVSDVEQGVHKIFYNNETETNFDTLETYDINNLILDFDYRFDMFIREKHLMIGSPNFRIELDTFKNQISGLYKDIKNPYFRDYVYYSFASTDQLGNSAKMDLSIQKALLFKEYLSSGKIKYDHGQFMLFFNQFYTDVFKLTFVTNETALAKAINSKSSPKMLHDLLKQDDFLKNEQVRELVIIKGLMEEYYTNNYYQENIITILDSIRDFSIYNDNRVIAGNVRQLLTHLGVGYDAPFFSMKNQKDEPVSMATFRGKYVYLQFWSTWNTTSVTEMKLVAQLKKRYGQDFEFISISLDEDKEEWKKFMKAHPEFNWTQLHYSDYPEIISDFRINSIPQYYLFGPDGKFIQSPAYRPTPNGTFISIDKTMWEISMRLHPDYKSGGTPRDR